MQVQNVTLTQNNYSKKHNPNFTAIKSVKCTGLYKKYPELANELVDAFKQNPTAMKFCKKYDVDIVFHAVKQSLNKVQSSLHIFYDNISKTKAQKFFDSLLGNNEDKIAIHSCGNEYSILDSIQSSTKELVQKISPGIRTEKGWRGGYLNSHLKSGDDSIQDAVNKKLQKLMEKDAKLRAVKNAETNFKNANVNLKESINDLINKSS